MNLVFHPSVIDTYFSLKIVYKYQLTTDYDKGLFSMSLIEKGIVENGYIQWTKEIDEADMEYWDDLNQKISRIIHRD